MSWSRNVLGVIVIGLVLVVEDQVALCAGHVVPEIVWPPDGALPCRLAAYTDEVQTQPFHLVVLERPHVRQARGDEFVLGIWHGG